jgi:hypothetical protein
MARLTACKSEQQCQCPTPKCRRRFKICLVCLLYVENLHALSFICSYDCCDSPVLLCRCVKGLQGAGLKVLADIVINHRCAAAQDEQGVWNVFGGKLAWDADAVRPCEKSAALVHDPTFRTSATTACDNNFHVELSRCMLLGNCSYADGSGQRVWNIQALFVFRACSFSCQLASQIVGDHFEFRGRGNESSGDPFPAAPNLDHSADFVKRDLSEWLRWMRTEYGFDGWR